jgi:archaellum component FlaC
VTPHDKRAPNQSQEAPLLHTPHEQQLNEELDDANVRLREACKLSEKEREHNRESSSLKKHYELEAKLSLVSPDKHLHKSKTDMELDDVSEQLQQANMLLEEYHELRNQESEDKQSTSSIKRQCDELEAKLSSVTEQLQQAKKLVEEHEQKTSSLKKQCDELKAKLSSVILDPKICKRENKSLSKTAVAEVETSFLRAAQEKADGYNGVRHDMSNAKSYEFISTECDLTRNTLSKVDKQVQDLRELVNEKKMKLKECQERCKNRHEPCQFQLRRFSP